jgi:hypothetical protein
MEIFAEILVQIAIWVVQFLGELLLQLVGELIVGLVGRSLKEPFRSPKPFHPWLAAIGYGIFGAIAGAVSLWAFPLLFISTQWLRISNLIATPVIAGLMMERLGAWREKKDQETMRLDTFAYGFIFALSMALVRFTWGH